MMKVSTFPTRFDVDFFPICLMWMDLEIVILSEVSQRKTNTI